MLTTNMDMEEFALIFAPTIHWQIIPLTSALTLVLSDILLKMCRA